VLASPPRKFGFQEADEEKFAIEEGVLDKERSFNTGESLTYSPTAEETPFSTGITAAEFGQVLKTLSSLRGPVASTSVAVNWIQTSQKDLQVQDQEPAFYLFENAPCPSTNLSTSNKQLSNGISKDRIKFVPNRSVSRVHVRNDSSFLKDRGIDRYLSSKELSRLPRPQGTIDQSSERDSSHEPSDEEAMGPSFDQPSERDSSHEPSDDEAMDPSLDQSSERDSSHNPPEEEAMDLSSPFRVLEKAPNRKAHSIGTPTAHELASSLHRTGRRGKVHSKKCTRCFTSKLYYNEAWRDGGIYSTCVRLRRQCYAQGAKPPPIKPRKC
jgi:hypothetical protein